MAISELKPFSVPDEFREASGLTTRQPETDVVYVTIVGHCIDGVWYVLTGDPDEPPVSAEDSYGAFTEDDSRIDGGQILLAAGDWLSNGRDVAGIAGEVIRLSYPWKPDDAYGLARLFLKKPKQ